MDLNYFIDAIGTEQRKSESHLNQTKEEVVAIASFKLPFFNKGEVMAASIVEFDSCRTSVESSQS